jgi:hypothetical protein
LLKIVGMRWTVFSSENSQFDVQVLGYLSEFHRC